MEFTTETNEALEVFRRAAKNGQPILALESLVSVVNEIVAELTRDETEDDVPKSAEATANESEEVLKPKRATKTATAKEEADGRSD